MSKYGKKHACWSCGTKFYDFGKPDPKCPKCQADPAAAPATESAAAAIDDFDDDDEDAAALARKLSDDEEE